MTTVSSPRRHRTRTADRRRSMKTLLSAVLTATLAITPSIRTHAAPQPHEPSPQPAEPSPELRKEGDYLVGNWRLVGETKRSPFGPGGEKFESSERVEWIPGGFFLVARSYQDDKWMGLTIIGYDQNRKVLTHTTYNATGEVEVMERTDDAGGTETWSGKVDGKPVKERLIIKKVSPVLYTFRFEMAPEGGRWSLVHEGKGVKVP